jgi:hypothetical protein
MDMQRNVKQGLNEHFTPLNQDNGFLSSINQFNNNVHCD